MNFDDAIKAHVSWKIRLKQYIQKPDRSYSAEVVSQDNLCDLGKWIHGEGEALYGKNPDFTHLKSEHAEFHKAASNIIKKADSGHNVTEELALGANSEFTKYSNSITTIIMKLRQTKAA